jgi:CspA family cold shock protein
LLKKGAGRFQVSGVSLQQRGTQSGIASRGGGGGGFGGGGFNGGGSFNGGGGGFKGGGGAGVNGGGPSVSQASAGSKRSLHQSQQPLPLPPRW